jgi:hypothetical protein
VLTTQSREEREEILVEGGLPAGYDDMSRGIVTNLIEQSVEFT